MNQKNQKLKVPPQNIDAEKATLGSIMLKPVILQEIMSILNEDDFYVQKHRVIFRIMSDLSRTGDPIDLISVSEKMLNLNLVEQAGGVSYLNELANTVPSSAHIEYYAK